MYDLHKLEQKYLSGEQLTESELTALQEGPRWDAIKKGAGKVARGVGKVARGVAQGVGALAGAVKKGYNAASGEKQPARSSIGRATQQVDQQRSSGTGGSAAGGSASTPASGSAPTSKSAAELDATLNPGDPVEFTNKKGVRGKYQYVGLNPQNPEMLLLKNTRGGTFPIYPTQVIGNEPAPTTQAGFVGDIQKARYQAGLMPDSQFNVKQDAARNQAVAPSATVDKTKPVTAPRATTAVRDARGLGQDKAPVPRGGDPNTATVDKTKQVRGRGSKK